MFHEEAKAIQEIAKTTGKVVDASRALGGYFSRFSDGPMAEAASYIAEQIRYSRFERQISFFEKVSDRLAKSPHLASHMKAIPLKILAPLLEAATLEDDEALQQRWAALLINASNDHFPIKIQRSYLSILEQLSTLDALVIDRIYSLPFEQIQHNGATIWGLPEQTSVFDQSLEIKKPSDEVLVSVGNLVRLGCLRSAMTWGGGESFERVLPTVLGKHFVLACRDEPIPSGCLL